MMCSSEKKLDIGFAFNHKDFSDRVLHLQITPKETKSPHRGRKRKPDSVHSVHISTPILAAQSPFFYKLFQSEMKESAQKDVTLMINSTEELGALMDVLKFMYKNTLEATTSSELLAVLMAADKFQVICCMEYCIQALLKSPISVDLALVYIDLPPSVSASEVVQPLIEASRKVLAAEFMDFTKFQQTAMELPLSAIEFVLTSDGLQVSSEDVVFDFVLKWSRAHYPNAKKRQETLTKHLWPLVHFQHMSWLKLKELLVCINVEPHKQVLKLVSDALMAKVESPYGQHLNPPEGGPGRRAYICPLVHVVRLHFPRPSCLVYLYLRRDECEGLFPSKLLNSQWFVLGGQSFYLSVACKKEEPHCLGLFLHGTSNVDVDYEFAVMSKSSNDFQPKLTIKNCKFEVGRGWGKSNLLGIPWAGLISDGSIYFIDDILRLRAKIILNSSH